MLLIFSTLSNHFKPFYFLILVFRNARCEEKASIIYERECRSMIEAFYAKAEKYFHTGKCKSNLSTDSIDLAAVEWNEDRDKLFKEVLTNTTIIVFCVITVCKFIFLFVIGISFRARTRAIKE